MYEHAPHAHLGKICLGILYSYDVLVFKKYYLGNVALLDFSAPATYNIVSMEQLTIM